MYKLVFLCMLLCGLSSCRQHRTPKKISFVSSKPSQQRGGKASASYEHSRISPSMTLSLMDIVDGAPVENIILQHTGFVVSYNHQKCTPSWVAWELTSEETTGPISRKDYDFAPDPMLEAHYQVEKYEYANSGYDRGHMCPAGDMEWSSSAMNDCHYMTNICPQTTKLNQIYWERLESACRRWADLYGSIYIVCGPTYNSGKHTIIGTNHKIAIPDGYFKVVITLVEGKEKGIGFYYKNDDVRQTMESASMTINQVEELTGYDFFANLPDELEQHIETQNRLSSWR
ncbi:MAG: DNA/RNA non-specific endonuclease [Prevotella sp.]|nr:DNA/RNA non-specific endonuclease [Prevotella sp.]